MAEQVLRLIYPPTLLNVPVVNKLIRSYTELTVNILRAEVDATRGWIEIQLVGHSSLIESAIGWLRSQGIEVQTLRA